MSRLILILFCLAMSGCNDTASVPQPERSADEPKPPQPPPSASAPNVPSYKGPALLERVFDSALGEGGYVTKARVLVPNLSTKDPIRILLHWEPAGTAARKIGALDWTKTMESLSLKIAGPDGNLKTYAVKPPSTPIGFQWTFDLMLSIDAGGVAAFGDAPRHAWKDNAPSFGPGKHQIKIEGQLGDPPLRFISAPIEVELHEPNADFKPLADVEQAAAAHVFAVLNEKPKDVAKPTLEDAEGNRVVRFVIGRESARYELTFVEVVVDRRAKARGLSRAQLFTCIAQGTLVATPSGSRPIETLQRGAPVWSFDTARGERQLSRVVERVSLGERRVIELAPGLRVTPEHPVWVDDVWRHAGEVTTGARLLGMLGPIEATPREAGRATVYDLEVEAPHTFFAGGVLVHNKAAESPQARGIRLNDWDNIDFRP